MIGKEEFVKLIQEHEEQNERIDTLCSVFPNSYGDPILNWGFRMFDKVINAYFTEEGEDWIGYFLYENPEKCYYQDDKKIPLVTIDDLWNTIKEYRK